MRLEKGTIFIIQKADEGSNPSSAYIC